MDPQSSSCSSSCFSTHAPHACSSYRSLMLLLTLLTLLLMLPRAPPHPPRAPPHASCAPLSSHGSSPHCHLRELAPLRPSSHPLPLLALLTKSILPHLLRRACMFLTLATITLSSNCFSSPNPFCYSNVCDTMYVIQPITVRPLVLAAGDDKLSMNISGSSRSYR